MSTEGGRSRLLWPVTAWARSWLACSRTGSCLVIVPGEGHSEMVSEERPVGWPADRAGAVQNGGCPQKAPAGAG